MHSPTTRGLITLTALGLLALAPLAGAQDFQHPAGGTSPGMDDFDPPGTLWDNDVNNGTTSLASQDSDGDFTARTADDFTLDDSCPTGVYDITAIRIQIVQAIGADQPFAIDVYADNGMGTAPTPADAIAPIASFAETSQTLLGPFGGSQIYEASFDTEGFTLTPGTYWISGWGTDGVINAGGFNNFFAASDGAAGTTPNGVIIAPDLGIGAWTPVEIILGDPPLAFSFAIDGVCQEPAIPVVEVPTLGQVGLVLLLLSLLGAGFYRLRRR